MKLKYKIFKSALSSWEELFTQATEFATELGDMRVVNISHSCDGGKGVVVVWYWADD
jgi:hypothetical protein